ncbi:MAG: signal peptide peptidase SppA [Acidobacteria bacterium]|nr:MAG: signal peptide peptidase SppA [Acidobacteriota bacterium]
MRGRTLLLVVLGLVVLIVIVLAIGIFFFWAFQQPVSIAEGSVLEVVVSGSMPEVPPTNALVELLQPSGLNLFGLRQAFEYAAKDDRIKAVYLEIQPLSMSFAEIEEVRDQIIDFRKSKKRVHAFLALDLAGEAEMYLASACDSITLNPGAGLLVNGLLAEVSFYKGTLDKLHVKPEFIEFKEYKNPGTYSRTQMTPEYRGMLESIVRDIEDRFVTAVAADRKISPERLRELMRNGIIKDDVALREKLVDSLGYKHDVRDGLKLASEAGKKTYKGVGAERYRSAAAADYGISTGTKVAFVAAEGIITSGSSEEFGGIVGGNTMSTMLARLREDKSVKGIILRVNSPGGSVVGSEMVWEEVRMLEKQGKPVIVSMSGVAASGGYYISMSARKILTQPSTITGSVGVIFGKFDLSGFYDWVGMNVEQVKISPNADIFSLSNGMSDEQRKQVETWMADVYDTFVGKAAKSRKIDPDQMENKARGRVYTGIQAKAAGLVDEIGGVKKAVEDMRQALKLSKDEKLHLVLYPRPKTLWESLSSGDLLPVKMPKIGQLKAWIEAEASSLTTPAPWILAPAIRLK